MTDLSTPSTGGLPPMTLEQAIHLANMMRTVQHKGAEFIGRGATHQSLLDHACSAYKAAIVLFEHCIEVEELLSTVRGERDQAMALLADIHRMVKRASDDPVSGTLFRALLMPDVATESDEMGGVSQSNHRAETLESPETARNDHFEREIASESPETAEIGQSDPQEPQ